MCICTDVCNYLSMNNNICCYTHYVNTDLQIPTPMNVTITESETTSGSFVVQWDPVTELTVTYTVRWYIGDDEIGMASVDGLSYIVTGLTANTSYNVIVALMYCGEVGPYSEVIMATTNMTPTTPPPTSTPTTSGNVVFMHIYIYTYTQ